MLHVDLPLDTQVTSELSPFLTVGLFFIYKTIGCVHQTRPKQETKLNALCSPNKTKEGNKAFSYLFRTHLLITISVMVSGRLGAKSRMEVFLHQA